MSMVGWGRYDKTCGPNDQLIFLGRKKKYHLSHSNHIEEVGSSLSACSSLDFSNKQWAGSAQILRQKNSSFSNLCCLCWDKSKEHRGLTDINAAIRAHCPVGISAHQSWASFTHSLIPARSACKHLTRRNQAWARTLVVCVLPCPSKQ